MAGSDSRPNSMRQNVYNVVFFLFLGGAAVALWLYADQNWFPKNEVRSEERRGGKECA